MRAGALLLSLVLYCALLELSVVSRLDSARVGEGMHGKARSSDLISRKIIEGATIADEFDV